MDRVRHPLPGFRDLQDWNNQFSRVNHIRQRRHPERNQCAYRTMRNILTIIPICVLVGCAVPGIPPGHGIFSEPPPPKVTSIPPVSAIMPPPIVSEPVRPQVVIPPRPPTTNTLVFQGVLTNHIYALLGSRDTVHWYLLTNNNAKPWMVRSTNAPAEFYRLWDLGN